MHDLSTLWYNLNLSVLTLHLEVCMFHILWATKYTRYAKNYTVKYFDGTPMLFSTNLSYRQNIVHLHIPSSTKMYTESW